MELCVLPQTGASDAIWPIVIVVAAALIVTGGVLLRSDAARRRVLTGVGALAIVGALALGSVAAAPAAQADAGTRDCVTAPATPTAPAPTQPAEAAPAESELPPRPEPTIPEIVTVTPAAPTAAAQCGDAPAIAIPTLEGVTYTEAQEGSTLTVTAAAQPGYVLAIGAPSTWTFDLTPTPVAENPVALPDAIPAFPQLGNEETQELSLWVFDTAAFDDLAAAGVPYELVVADELVIPYDVYGPDGEYTTDTESIPWSATLVYDDVAQQLVLTPTDPDGLQASIEAALAAVEARHPDADVNQSFLPDFGMALVATFEPGPGCAPEVTTVPIEFALV